MAERLNAAVLKTVSRDERLVGSNPTLSSSLRSKELWLACHFFNGKKLEIEQLKQRLSAEAWQAGNHA